MEALYHVLVVLVGTCSTLYGDKKGACLARFNTYLEIPMQ
jgi:hypothetical protein